MKTILALILLCLALLAWFGSPFARPARGIYYGSPEAILPMSFAHIDHQASNCVGCHHNYTDGSGGGQCMNCHVSDPDIWPLFEAQFHALCRDCHVKEASAHRDSGPTRRCDGCHQADSVP